MTSLISLIIGIVFLLLIYVNRSSVNSTIWVLIGLTLVNNYFKVIKVPIDIGILRWLIYSVLVFQLSTLSRFRKQFQSFPLRKFLIFMIVCTFLVAFVDSRLSLYQKLYKPFREITETYFIVFISYFSLRNRIDFLRLGRPILYLALIIGVVGILNYVLKANPYYEWVIRNFYVGGEVDHESKESVLKLTSDRFRATSTFDYTFNYGYVSALFSILLLHFLKLSKSRLKFLMIVGLILSFIGIVLSFSRTVFFAAILGIVFSVYFGNEFSRVLKYFLFGIVLFFAAYIVSPPFNKAVDNSLDLLETGGSKVSGSSFEMRQMQFAGAFYYFSQAPLFGNGYYYINKELGWGDRDSGVTDKTMFGYESFLFVLMIEQGILGLVSKLGFFILLFVYFFKHRRVNKSLSGIGIGLTVLFFAFAMGTGVLGAWPFTMLIVGWIIKTLEIQKQAS